MAQVIVRAREEIKTALRGIRVAGKPGPVGELEVIDHMARTLEAWLGRNGWSVDVRVLNERGEDEVLGVDGDDAEAIRFEIARADWERMINGPLWRI